MNKRMLWIVYNGFYFHWSQINLLILKSYTRSVISLSDQNTLINSETVCPRQKLTFKPYSQLIKELHPPSSFPPHIRASVFHCLKAQLHNSAALAALGSTQTFLWLNHWATVVWKKFSGTTAPPECLAHYCKRQLCSSPHPALSHAAPPHFCPLWFLIDLLVN